jgi:hypothetical protein
MQHDWHSTHYTRLRQWDLQCEANQHRLAQEVMQSRRGQIIRIYGPALYRIGSVMTIWGQRLQTTYGEPAALRLDHVESGGRGH